MPQKVTPTNELSTKQLAFVAAFVAGKNVQEAALVAGVVRETGQRWLQDDRVQAAIREAKNATYTEGLGILKNAVLQAVNKLLACLNDETASWGTQIRASEVILKHALDVHSIQEHERRIEELERLLEEKNGL